MRGKTIALKKWLGERVGGRGIVRRNDFDQPPCLKPPEMPMGGFVFGLIPIGFVVSFWVVEVVYH